MQLPDDDYQRLRWRCSRRGLLELDIVLTRFLDTGYAHLDESQARAFAELVELEDHDLLDLLTGRGETQNPAHGEMLGMLRCTR